MISAVEEGVGQVDGVIVVLHLVEHDLLMGDVVAGAVAVHRDPCLVHNSVAV